MASLTLAYIRGLIDGIKKVPANRIIWAPSKTHIEAGDSIRVSAKHQQLIYGRLINEGEIINDGEIIFL